MSFIYSLRQQQRKTGYCKINASLIYSAEQRNTRNTCTLAHPS